MGVQLYEVLGRHRYCMFARWTLNNALREDYPKAEHILDINLALAAYDCGIARSIMQRGSLTPADELPYIQRLEKEFGLSNESAKRAVLLWQIKRNIFSDLVQKMADKEKERDVIEDELPADIPKVEGNESDYRIGRDWNDRYIIQKFIGFEKDNIIVPNYIDGKRIRGISHGEFEKCTQIQSITVPEGIEFLGGQVFRGCSKLTTISLPTTLKEIQGSELFKECVNLKYVDFPDALQSLGAEVCYFCKSLERVKLPKNLKEIGDHAFFSCEKMVDVDLPDGLIFIDAGAFWGCGITHLALNEGLEQLGNTTKDTEVFRCLNLKSIVFPRSLKVIGSNVFGRKRRGANDGWWPIRTMIYCYPNSYAMEWVRRHGYQSRNAEELELN